MPGAIVESTQRAQRKAKEEHINCTHNLKMLFFVLNSLCFPL
jgi:hypothetical protein